MRDKIPLKERLKGRLKRLLNRKVSEGLPIVNHSMRSIIPHSQTMATTQAQQAVFNTYELLEHILLHLPLTTLILVNRVCRYWHALTKDSINIRRALFLESSQAPAGATLVNPFLGPILLSSNRFPVTAPRSLLRRRGDDVDHACTKMFLTSSPVPEIHYVYLEVDVAEPKAGRRLWNTERRSCHASECFYVGYARRVGDLRPQYVLENMRRVVYNEKRRMFMFGDEADWKLVLPWRASDGRFRPMVVYSPCVSGWEVLELAGHRGEEQRAGS